ncbi:MAG TPA: VOC family protein [Chloroflexota bacterium]|nr:VOC family protein [Chloroflexota bacterium]
MSTITIALMTRMRVRNIERSVAFYQALFGFPMISSDERRAVLRMAGKQTLFLFKKGAPIHPMVTPGATAPPRRGDGRTHMAFAIDAADLDHWERWLSQHEVVIESKGYGKKGSQSLYFRDPDDHLLELVPLAV